MPEGHSIHIAARDHNRLLSGTRLRVSSPQGRFADGAEAIDKRTLREVEPYGKHLFYWFGRDLGVHVHLGMYGRFTRYKSPPPEPRGAVRMRLEGPETTFDLRGPTACELVDRAGRDEIVARLGVDPLRPDSSADRVWARATKSRAALGRLLLDQSFIAGVGNIVRVDALFDQRLAPSVEARALSRERFDALFESAARMLKDGVRFRKLITSVEPGTTIKQARALRGRDRFLVYGRERCAECDAKVRVETFGGRKLYWCARCQAA